MLKKLFQKKVLLSLAIFSQSKVNPEDMEQFQKTRGLFIEDPWERVKSMFQLDDYGNIHPEMQYTIQMAQYGLVISAMAGGCYESIMTTAEFIRSSDTNIYRTRNEALRTISRVSTMGFYKGMVKYAPKYTIFCAGFSLLSSCWELYRNKSGIIENTVGGAGIGAILRSKYGIKGMISGGVVGGIIGTIFGIISVAIYKISNTNKTEIKYAAIAFARERKERMEKAKQEALQKAEAEFLKKLNKNIEDKAKEESSEPVEESSVKKT